MIAEGKRDRGDCALQLWIGNWTIGRTESTKSSTWIHPVRRATFRGRCMCGAFFVATTTARSASAVHQLPKSVIPRFAGAGFAETVRVSLECDYAYQQRAEKPREGTYFALMFLRDIGLRRFDLAHLDT